MVIMHSQGWPLALVARVDAIDSLRSVAFRKLSTPTCWSVKRSGMLTLARSRILQFRLQSNRSSHLFNKPLSSSFPSLKKHGVKIWMWLLGRTQTLVDKWKWETTFTWSLKTYFSAISDWLPFISTVNLSDFGEKHLLKVIWGKKDTCEKSDSDQVW